MVIIVWVFPNNEVEEGFIKFLLPFTLVLIPWRLPLKYRNSFVKYVPVDYESFFRRLQSFFADTPYELVRDLELHYQNVLFIVLQACGLLCQSPNTTRVEGRVDPCLCRQINSFM